MASVAFAGEDTTASCGALAVQPVIPARPAAPSIESLLTKRWARFLIPSLSDLYFLAVGVWLFMASGSTALQALLGDGDVGWHIRTGDYILDHHAVPQHDLYSFAKPDAPWYAWEWLTDVLDSGLHRLGGLKAVALAAAVVICLFAVTLIQRMVRRGAHLMVGMIFALLGFGAATVHFLARPHVFTLLFTSGAMWLIEADRERPSPRIWWLVPLAVLWTNMHGGFLALIAVLGLTTAGTAVETFLNGRWKTEPWRECWRSVLRYASLTAACAAATLVNPYGWRLHQHVIAYLRSDWIRNMVQEFQSPSFRNENMLQFEVVLLVGLMMALSLFQRRRVVEGLWIVFWAHMALSSTRHVPVFIAVAAPVIASEVTEWWNHWTGRAGKASLAGIVNQISADSAAGFRRTSIWPFVTVAVVAFMGAPIHWPQDFPDAMFPTQIVHEHAQLINSSRVFTTDQWADYLIYVEPRRKVFVDGRSDFYGPEVGNEYLHALDGEWDWQQILTKYQFNVVLVPAQSALAQLLKLSPDWRGLADDGKRILLVRNGTPVPTPGNFHAEPRF